MGLVTHHSLYNPKFAQKREHLQSVAGNQCLLQSMKNSWRFGIVKHNSALKNGSLKIIIKSEFIEKTSKY